MRPVQSYDTELFPDETAITWSVGQVTIKAVKRSLLKICYKACENPTDKISSSLNMFRLTSDPQALLTWQISGFELHVVRSLVCILNSLERHSAGLSGTNQLTSCDTLKLGWIITNLTAACRGEGGNNALFITLCECFARVFPCLCVMARPLMETYWIYINTTQKIKSGTGMLFKKSPHAQKAGVSNSGANSHYFKNSSV